MPPKRKSIGRSTTEARKKKALRVAETYEQRESRLETNRLRTAHARSIKKEEQRKLRFGADRLDTAQALSNETEEEQELRLGAFQADYWTGNGDESSVVDGNDSDPYRGEEEETVQDSKIFVTPLKSLTDDSRSVEVSQERLPRTRQEDVRTKEDDECNLFGKLVEVKLRKLDEVTRQYVMNDIGGILLRASVHTNTHMKNTNSTSDHPRTQENSSSASTS